MLVGPTCLYNDYIDYINGNNILKYQVWIRLVLHSTAASKCRNLRKFERKKILIKWKILVTCNLALRFKIFPNFWT